MHRTTINLDEGVYRRVKRVAERNGESMARTIESLLKSALYDAPAAKGRVPLHGGNGPNRGIDIADRDALYELMEGR
jgi:hypothetical protein